MKNISLNINRNSFLTFFLLIFLFLTWSFNLPAQQKISISPLSSSGASGSEASSADAYGREWSDPMMIKSDKVESSKTIRNLSASSLLYFDHYESESSKSFKPDQYPDIFSYPGLISEDVLCEEIPLFDCFKQTLDDEFPLFVEDGFYPTNPDDVPNKLNGPTNAEPVIANINSEEVIWPYKIEPYEGDGIDQTYPATVGVDILTFAFDLAGDFIVGIVQQLGALFGISDIDEFLDKEDGMRYDLVGFNSSEFGDDILVPIYNTIAFVGVDVGDIEPSYPLPQIIDMFSDPLYFSPIAVFRKDIESGKIKFNGYSDSKNRYFKKAFEYMSVALFLSVGDRKFDQDYIDWLVTNIEERPLTVDFAMLELCFNALSIQKDLYGTLEVGRRPYYSEFADYEKTIAGKTNLDLPRICALSLLRFASYHHSNATDVVAFNDHVVVINQMPVLNSDEVVAFGRPVSIKEADGSYSTKTWGEYLNLEDGVDLWASAVTYKCKEEEKRTGYFNDDCELAGFTLIPANSYNAVAVEDGILVATPNGIYKFNPELDFPDVSFASHANLSVDSIPFAERLDLDLEGSDEYIPYGISSNGIGDKNYVAITYRTIGEESIENHPLRAILKDKRIFGDNAFADYVNVCKYVSGELKDCQKVQNSTAKSAIVDADIKDVDNDGYIDLVFTDLVLGQADDGSSFNRTHVCYKINSLDCQEVKVGDSGGGVGVGPLKPSDVYKYMKEEPMYLGTSKVVAGEGVLTAIFGGRPPMLPNGGCANGEKDDPVFSPIGHMMTLVQNLAYTRQQDESRWYNAFKFMCGGVPECLKMVELYHKYPTITLKENSMCTPNKACFIYVNEKKYSLPLWGGSTKTYLEKTVVLDQQTISALKGLDYEFCCKEGVCYPEYSDNEKYNVCLQMICYRKDQYDPAPQVKAFCDEAVNAWKPGGSCNPVHFEFKDYNFKEYNKIPEKFDSLGWHSNLTVLNSAGPVIDESIKLNSSGDAVMKQNGQIEANIIANSSRFASLQNLLSERLVSEDVITGNINRADISESISLSDVKSSLRVNNLQDLQDSLRVTIPNKVLNDIGISDVLGSGSEATLPGHQMFMMSGNVSATEGLTKILKRYRLPPGIPMEGKFQIGTVLLKKAEPGTEKECVTSGFSSNYMKGIVESLEKDAKSKWGVITGFGELGYSTVKCRVKIANASDDYVVAYTKGPMPIDFADEERNPETIKLLSKAVTIAPLDASYKVMATSENKGSTITLDLSQSSLVSLPAPLSSLATDMELDIGRLSDDVGVEINRHIGHTIIKPKAGTKASGGKDESEVTHEIFVNLIPPCASWSARGGGGEKCPPPEMNEAVLRSTGKWDDRYVYKFTVVGGTKSNVSTDDQVWIGGADSLMFGRGGGCLCDVNSRPLNVYETIFGLFAVVMIGTGFVFARQRAKRKK